MVIWEAKRPGVFARPIIAKIILEIMQAMEKALATGVVEYHIGSRGLKRFTLKELTDLLDWWRGEDIIALDPSIGRGMQARRAYPTDY